MITVGQINFHSSSGFKNLRQFRNADMGLVSFKVFLIIPFSPQIFHSVCSMYISYDTKGESLLRSTKEIFSLLGGLTPSLAPALLLAFMQRHYCNNLSKVSRLKVKFLGCLYYSSQESR